MGKLVDLLQAAAGEQSLDSDLGQWRLALSESIDEFVDFFDGFLSQSVAGVNSDLVQSAAGEVSLNSALGRWRLELSSDLDTINALFATEAIPNPASNAFLGLLGAAGGQASLNSILGFWRSSVSQSADRIAGILSFGVIYSFQNLTSSPQTVTGLSLFGGPLTSSITVKALQTLLVPGFNPQFVSLLGNLYAQSGSLALGTGRLGTPIAIRTHVSLAPSPTAPTTNIRATFTAAETLTPAEVGALTASPPGNPGLNSGGSVAGIIQNAQTLQYNFIQNFTNVDPAGTWIEFPNDQLGSYPIDPNNGQIQIAIGYVGMQGPGNTAVPINVRILPAIDPTAQLSPLPTYKDDTWQRLPDGAKPRHSSVAIYLSDDRVMISHGSEHPFCESFASLETSIFDPDNFQVSDGPNVTTPRFDTAFTEKSILCSDGKHRAYVANGFPSNDEVLNITMIAEAFTEENNSWDASIRLHYQGPFAIGSSGITDGFGNMAIAFGPNQGPVAGLPSLSTTNIIKPGAIVPGGPFPPTGQYYWTTASNGPFPPGEFDFGLLFTATMTQMPSGWAGNPFVPPAQGAPAFALTAGQFLVDPVGGKFWFSAADAGKLVMTVTPYRVKSVTADAPDGTKRIRSLVAGDVILPNGKYMIIGGLGSDSHPSISFASAVAIPEILDPNTGLWADAAAMPEPVNNEPPGTVLHPNGLVYVFGGVTLSIFTGVATPKVQIYNPGTVAIDPGGGIGPIAPNTWVLGAAFPLGGLARTCRPIVLNDGDIMIAGGAQAPGPVISTIPASNKTWRYRPSTNTWTQVGNMVIGIGAGWTYKILDGRVLQVGGSQHETVQGDRSLVSAVQIFNPSTNSWSQLHDHPAFVGGHWYRAVLFDDGINAGKLLYSGGIATVVRNNLQGQPSPGLNLYCPPRT